MGNRLKMTLFGLSFILIGCENPKMKPIESFEGKNLIILEKQPTYDNRVYVRVKDTSEVFYIVLHTQDSKLLQVGDTIK